VSGAGKKAAAEQIEEQLLGLTDQEAETIHGCRF
jgi:hypothetical protein